MKNNGYTASKNRGSPACVSISRALGTTTSRSIASNNPCWYGTTAPPIPATSRAR